MNTQAIVLFILLASIGVSAQVDRNVAASRTRYSEVLEKARLAESDEDRGQYGDLIMDQLEINKLGHPWRAVGIHSITAKFFYTGGDTEEHMYPDELVLVRIERRTSSRSYRDDLLYSKAGALILCVQKAENDETQPAERRIYFSAGRAIGVDRGGRFSRALTAAQRSAAAGALATSRQLKNIFSTTTKL